MRRLHDSGLSDRDDADSDRAPFRERAADILADYDERLRSQQMAVRESADPLKREAETPPEELTGCLHLLQRVWPRSASSETQDPHPTHIGRFEIEQVLGSGGFGIVYLARDPILNRPIALKIPWLHSLVDQGLRERFRREACAAALLDHPNIVPIYESGEAGPWCYIAAAYCPGPTLAEWLKEQTSPVPIATAVSLVACLADAAHYSHSQGVLHRDLKPGNVILVPRLENEEPRGAFDLPFIPRLTDFGLAKLRDAGLEHPTLSAVLGTPSYMAPEQTCGSREKGGIPVDVYGLGVILYELLVGRPPFTGEQLADVIDQVLREEPVSPRRLRREVSRDLETICLKCLEKSPQSRYASAQELAADLRRFLAAKPIKARRPGIADHVIKAVRRRPMMAALSTTIIAAALTIWVLLVWNNQRLAKLAGELELSLTHVRGLKSEADASRQSAERTAAVAEQRQREAEEAKDTAETQRRLADRVAYASAIRLAELAWREGDIRQCRILLANARSHASPHRPAGLEWGLLDRLTRAEFRELGNAEGSLFCLAVTPDRRTLAVGGERGVIQVIDSQSGMTKTTLRTQHDDVRAIAFSRDGDRLAVCGESKSISVWSLITGERSLVSPEAPTILKSVTWLLDDQRIATSGSFPGVYLWQVADGGGFSVLPTEQEVVSTVTAARDGRLLVAGGRDGTIWSWDSETLEQIQKLGNGSAIVSCIAVSPAGNLLAAGTNDHRVHLYELDNSENGLLVELLLTDDVRGLAFSTMGDHLAAIEQFGTLRLWTLESGVDPKSLRVRFQQGWLAHEQRGSQLAFLDASTELVSVGRGTHRPRRWHINGQALTRSIASNSPGKVGHHLPLIISPDSKTLIATHPGLRLWSIPTLEPLAELGDQRAEHSSLAISGDGRWLAASQSNGILELWDMQGAEHDQPVWRQSSQKVGHLSVSPKGDILAGASWHEDSVVLYDRSTGQRLRTLPAEQCHQAVYSADGRYLAVDDLDDVVVWDTSTWESIARLKGHLSTIRALAFCEDGRWLATGGRDREIRIWDTASWKLLHTMPGHRSDVKALSFVGGSNELISLDAGAFVKIWDPVTGLELGNLRTPAESSSEQLSVSTDGRYLAVRRWDGGIELQQPKDE